MRRLTAAITALVMIAVLFSVVPNPVAAQDNSTKYVVQPGDNLYRISLKFGLSLDALAQANGIVNPNFVYVGQTLIIPAGATIAPTATSPVATVPGLPVPTGDATTAATAAATSAATVAVTVSSGSTLDAGILGTATSTTAAPTATAAPVGTATPSAPVVLGPGGTYTVQAGDNLYRISLKFNTNMLALMQLNNIANPNLVYVGQVLTIPGQGTTTAGNVPASGTAVATASGTAQNTAGNVGFAFGITVDLAGQDATVLTQHVKTLGMGWVKLPVAWRSLEATKGTIDATVLDSQIDTLVSNNLKIMVTVYGAPDWARQTTAESGPPTDFNDYAKFVGALAARYKGKVLAYEVWTEPNLRREWAGRPLSAASYVEMLRLAYNAIKLSDSNALVISAGLSPTGYNDGVNAINDRVFLRQAYSAGLAAYSDAIGVHPNGWANPPDSTCCSPSAGVSGWYNDRSFYFRDTLKDYRDIMTQNNDTGTFIWATEFGWGSSEAVVADQNTVDPNFGFVKFTSQTQQAQYVPRAFEMARTLGYVGPMFLFNLNACQVVGNQPESSEFRNCYYSLLDANGQPRPVYTAVQNAPK